MSKLTADLTRRFLTAKTWFSERDGAIARSSLSDGEVVALNLPNGVGSQFILRDEELGDYEEGFILSVDDIRRKLSPVNDRHRASRP
jgi:hypothetical protein